MMCGSPLPWRAILLGMALVPSLARGENWPRFHGPNGSGVATGTTFPPLWSDADYRWRIELPGIGHGSPVVWGDKLFLLCASEAAPKPRSKGKGKGKGQAKGGGQAKAGGGSQAQAQAQAQTPAPGTTGVASPDGEATAPEPQRWMPLCLSTKDGSVQWRHDFAEGAFSGHRFNSAASTTPAVDGERVVFTWGTAEKLTMVAFTHGGDKLWETDLGPVVGGHGFAGSPILLGDLVILNNDQEDRKGCLLAVDARTGAIRWRVARRSERISYSVPCVFSHEGRDLLMFTNWRHGFTAIDPRDGAVVAEKSVFNQETNERAISSPVVYRDLVIGTCGFTANPKHCVAVRLTPDRRIEEVWRVDRNAPHIPSVVVVGDRCYLWDDAGIVTCVEAATGREIWKGRVPGVEGPCMGSPVSDGRTLFCADESGNVHALAVGDALKPLGKTPLGDLCRSTPAFGDGALFVRTAGRLVAVEGRKTD